MKLLLTTLNAKYIHSAPSLRYLYNSAGEEAEFLHFREFTINHDEGHIYSEIMRGNFNAVFFSCYIWNADKILYIAENLKKAEPDMRIILGGPEVAQRAEEILYEHAYIDLIALGEGESVFPLLLKAMVHNIDYTNIPGIAWRLEDNVYLNKPEDSVDFSLVPFLYDGIPWENDKIIYYETSRGCPFRCRYCLSSIDKNIRQRSVDMVKKEIALFLNGKVRQVKLIDRTFNYDHKRCYEILEYIMNHDNGVTNFHFEICGELITKEHLKLLENARPGLFRFEIGVQSTNRKTLEACCRSGNFNKVKENVKAISVKENITLHLDLIAGLPYEDYNTFKKSFNDVYSLLPDELQLGFLKLLPGTPLRDEAERYGYVYRNKAPYEIISNDFLSPKDILVLKDIEHVLDLFYNKGGFKNTLEYGIKAFSETPFDFYRELARFFHDEGLQHRAHAKEALYRIMYRFALEQDEDFPGMGQQMKELLREDMAKYLNPETVKRFDKKGWESKDWQ